MSPDAALLAGPAYVVARLEKESLISVAAYDVASFLSSQALRTGALASLENESGFGSLKWHRC